ncbi:HAD hydrolase-like protein [Paenibacillus lutrae]|uniref:HAD hydrolase-like protein n=1 Tax=Paenibacillus lutrae TaxID=2078573 RepID=A0A7X3K0N7_9BACL|nr:HAD hydrolase-like protein [Paenibacillus lutrae]MVP01297.1 HAD hydrolase-like protein [Paenibacillus lutrae]
MKFVLFDFDGTIANSLDRIEHVINQLADKHGFKRLEQDSLDELRSLTIAERCKRMGLPLYKLPSLVLEFNSLYRQDMSGMQPYAGMKELFGELKAAGYRLAVLSSNSEPAIRTFLAAHGMETDIDHVYCTKSLFGKHKKLRQFQKDLSLTAADLIYVGDEQRDIEACRKARVRMIAVTWGIDKPELLEAGRPDKLAVTPSDIPRYLEEFGFAPA